MRLIGLCGRARSGKDTVGSMIRDYVAQHGETVEMIAFAEPLKRFCGEVFGWTDAHLYGHLKDVPDDRYPRPPRWRSARERLGRWLLGLQDGPPVLTPRYAQQTLGTEWGRDCFEDAWVDYGLRRAKASPADWVVITDVRFRNEALAVQAAGGEVWRLNRKGQAIATSGHASEGQIMTIVPDVDIFNFGTLGELRREVSDLMEARCRANTTR